MGDAEEMQSDYMTLTDVANGMIREANKDNKPFVKVSKKLWLKIADFLIDTDNNLQSILVELDAF